VAATRSPPPIYSEDQVFVARIHRGCYEIADSYFDGEFTRSFCLGRIRPCGGQGQQALVIQGGTLIDGIGGAPVPNSVVIIQGNRITAVGRAGTVQVPAGAQIINANGKFVLPGLWDNQINYAWFWGELFLNAGVTSTVDIGDGEEMSAAERDAVNMGKIIAPRNLVAIGHLAVRATVP